jgi:hypothetical protein
MKVHDTIKVSDSVHKNNHDGGELHTRNNTSQSTSQQKDTQETKPHFCTFFCMFVFVVFNDVNDGKDGNDGTYLELDRHVDRRQHRNGLENVDVSLYQKQDRFEEI